MNKVLVEILGLSTNPSSGGAYAILLKEVYGSRRLPIIIGAFEAQAIALELEGIRPPRPLTHDLIKNLFQHLGGTVVEIIIDELKDNTFHAKILVEIASMSNEIDSRPSDAIAIAVRTDAPIYVSEEVMNAAGFVPSGEETEEDETGPQPSSGTEAPGSTSRVTKLASLENQLREALEKEDYERAAKIRDEIKKLSGNN